MESADIRQQAFNKKVGEFIEAQRKLQEEYGIVPVPVLDSSPYGIFPKVIYMDMESYNKQIDSIKNKIQV